MATGGYGRNWPTGSQFRRDTTRKARLRRCRAFEFDNSIPILYLGWVWNENRYKELQIRGLYYAYRQFQIFALNPHPFQQVLEVISNVTGLDKAVIYLKGDNDLKPAAGAGVFEPGKLVDRGKLEGLDHSRVHQEAFETVRESKKPVNIKSPETDTTAPYALVPILHGDELIGLIEVENHVDKGPVPDESLQTLESFSLQTAVAIRGG